MAEDLIPPPSPAGRPSGDADAERERARQREEAKRRHSGGLWSRSTSGDPIREAAEMGAAAEEAPQPKVDTPYRSRFGLVLGALLGIAIATLAVGAAIYVGTTGNNGAPDGWSAWEPTADDGLGAAEQIAEHVGRKYRLADGNQLVGVRASELEVFDVPLEVALRTAPQGGDIDFIDGNGLMYTLNGLGPKGSIRDGKSTKERGVLVRREALELALYTFRYIEDVDQVVVFLPPRKLTGEEEKLLAAATARNDPVAAAKLEPKKLALFFRPGDLEPQLEIPLRATIPANTPRPETLQASESNRIAALTENNVFEAAIQQGQDERLFLVLNRLAG